MVGLLAIKKVDGVSSYLEQIIKHCNWSCHDTYIHVQHEDPYFAKGGVINAMNCEIKAGGQNLHELSTAKHLII